MNTFELRQAAKRASSALEGQVRREGVQDGLRAATSIRRLIADFPPFDEKSAILKMVDEVIDRAKARFDL